MYLCVSNIERIACSMYCIYVSTYYTYYMYTVTKCEPYLFRCWLLFIKLIFIRDNNHFFLSLSRADEKYLKKRTRVRKRIRIRVYKSVK